MTHHRYTSLRRTLCFSYIIKNGVVRLIVPLSFIAVCVLLFLKIQQFGDFKTKSGFVPKTPEANLWDDLVKSGVTISNRRLFKQAVLLMRGESLNSSLRLANPKFLSRNDSMSSGDNISAGRFNHRHNSQNWYSKPGNLSGFLSEPLHNLKTSNAAVKMKRQPILAVILVISRPDNVLLRLAARKTWARDVREIYGFLVRFVVGRQENWDDIVDRESSMHNDVIIFEDDDVAEVLPSKVIHGIEWALELRPAPFYIMKIDDDTIVNMPYLAQELFRQNIVGTSQIVGSIREKVPVKRDLQNNIWAVSMLDYPASTYPPYVFGGGYVMRFKTAKELVEKRYVTYAWVHLEDVYLTGFVASRAGVSLTHHRGFSPWNSDKATACDFVLNRRINSINNTEQEFYELYKGIQFLHRSKNNSYCV